VQQARYSSVMAARPYTASRRRGSPESVDRVLEAAERLIRDDAFHSATMEEIAAAAGVSRATVFNRLGSKLGMLEALFTRAMESPEAQAIDEALAIKDPVASLEALIGAASAVWETHGYIHEQLEAIVVLEPEASAPVERHREEQRRDLQGLTRRLARTGRLRPGLGEARATATLHLVTSLESFLLLRRQHQLSLRQTQETLVDLAQALLRDEPRA
jgi:AcrR family transcriptional regulator